MIKLQSRSDIVDYPHFVVVIYDTLAVECIQTADDQSKDCYNETHIKEGVATGADVLDCIQVVAMDHVVSEPPLNCIIWIAVG